MPINFDERLIGLEGQPGTTPRFRISGGTSATDSLRRRPGRIFRHPLDSSTTLRAIFR